MTDREYADYPGRTWGQRLDDDYQALLRVARAGALVVSKKGHPTPCEDGQIYCELYKALKALPDGLLNDR